MVFYILHQKNFVRYKIPVTTQWNENKNEAEKFHPDFIKDKEQNKNPAIKTEETESFYVGEILRRKSFEQPENR